MNYFENISRYSQFGRNDLAEVGMRNGGSIDLNNDGFEDLIVTCDQLPGRLYWGGEGEPNFSSVHDPSVWVGGIAPSPGTSGIIFADFDNDGDLDFYAPNPYGNHHQLFMNTGNHQFEDVTETQGLFFPGDLALFNHTISGSWGDYDGDSYIDLLLLAGVDEGQNASSGRYLVRISMGKFHQSVGTTLTK